MSRKAKATVEMIHHYANLGDSADAEQAQRQRAERRVLALAVSTIVAEDRLNASSTAESFKDVLAIGKAFRAAVHALPAELIAQLEAEARA